MTFHGEARRYYRKAEAFDQSHVDRIDPKEQDGFRELEKWNDREDSIYLDDEPNDDHDDDGDDDEEWTTIETSDGVPKEDHYSTNNDLTTSIGRLQNIGGKLKVQGIQAAFEAAGTAGVYARIGARYLAEDVGFLSNCETIHEVAKQVLTKYPTLNDLKTAYCKGRNAARRARRGLKLEEEGDAVRGDDDDDGMVEDFEVRDSEPADAQILRPMKPRSEIEMSYGELEEVPIVDCEEGDDWEQFV